MIKKILFIAGCLILFIVMYISLIKKSSFDYIFKVQSFQDEFSKEGYGFVYKKENNKYYLLTNYHVISECNTISLLTSKGKKVNAVILGYDEYTDISVLTIDDNINIEIPNFSSDVSDTVYVFDFNGKKVGTLISLSESVDVLNSHFDAIKIDIDVESGNSGTPLFNKKNQIVGMISLKEKKYAYAIPINYLLDIATKIENGELKRPNLGANFVSTNNKEIIDQYSFDTHGLSGVIAFDIQDGYPLSRITTSNYIVITKIDGIEVNSAYKFRNILYKKSIGDEIELEYYLDGNKSNIHLVLDR